MQAIQQKTTLMRDQDVERKWHVVDAEGKILGRLSTEIAVLLMGKHRPEYTAHVDCGDFVIVLNAQKIRLTGNKAETKEYDSYSYYPGGRKVVPFATMLKRKPELIVTNAIRKMLPKSKLGRKMLSKLKVYRGSEHPHAAQCPEVLKIN